MKPLLVLGTKHISSWSLRPWLALKQAGVDFDERVILLDRKETRDQILEHSPSGRVPCLIHDGLAVWESLAICEYAADAFAPSLWPSSRVARAVARAVSMEVHASFLDLRRVCPMNLKIEPTFGMTLPPQIGGDVLRINAIWRDCRSRFGEGGPYLFGHFTIADAMFAPICTMYATYGIPSDDVGNAYLETILNLPALTAWKDAAQAEPDSPQRARR